MRKYFKWILESNRPKHLVCGLIVFFVIVIACKMLSVPFANSVVIALLTTVMEAGTVEYIQKQCGSRFDIFDLLSTVLLPLIITLFTVIISNF